MVVGVGFGFLLAFFLFECSFFESFVVPQSTEIQSQVGSFPLLLARIPLFDRFISVYP